MVGFHIPVGVDLGPSKVLVFVKLKIIELDLEVEPGSQVGRIFVAPFPDDHLYHVPLMVRVDLVALDYQLQPGGLKR